MSVFLDVVRFTGGDPVAGAMLPISRSQLDAVAERWPVVEADGVVGVKVAGGSVAVLQESGILSCQLAGNTNLERLESDLRDLAGLVPDAVVLDGEGNSLSEPDW